MTDRIYYAIIALKADEVDEVIKSLADEELTDLSEWLADHKDSMYGKFREDWKPFEDKSISKIIEESKPECYICQTISLSNLDDDCANTDILEGIDIFFIDVFAMYLQKYQKLAIRVDSKFMDAEKSKCCFLMNYTLPANLQDELEQNYNSTWKLVLQEYGKGSLHRVAARVNDVKNFKNFVKLNHRKDKDGANPRTKGNMCEYYREHNIPTNDRIPTFG